VGFTLEGKQPLHRTSVDDLDVLLMAPSWRFLPLLRVLSILQVKPVEENARLTFQVDGAPKAVIDLQTKELRIGDQVRKINLIEAQSVVTQGRDVYLLPNVLGELLNARITWAECVFRSPNTETVAGDSRFGLSDLVFPYATWRARMESGCRWCII